jgi:uncharacterized protein YwgA
MLENYKILAGVVEAHPNREVTGRIRLQRTTRILQRLRLPVDYTFSVHFDGPYSEELHSDLKLIQQTGLGTEECRRSREGEEYFIIRATAKAKLAMVDQFRQTISLIAAEDPRTVELASAYLQYREMGSTHQDALDRLRVKIGSTHDGKKTEAALILLKGLGLPVGFRVMRASA